MTFTVSIFPAVDGSCKCSGNNPLLIFEMLTLSHSHRYGNILSSVCKLVPKIKFVFQGYGGVGAAAGQLEFRGHLES